MKGIFAGDTAGMLLGRTLSLPALVIQLSLEVLLNSWHYQRRACLVSLCAWLTYSSPSWVSRWLL